MGELYNPFPKLPKNIRQIGDRDDVVRLYVEDYVNTYLKRLFPTGGQDLRVGILLGNAEQHDGMPYIFVDGALEMEDVAISGEKVTFSEAAWKKAYQSIEETFPKRTVQGWFLCGAPGCTLSPLNYFRQHGQYFSGKNQLMYLNGGIDGDESIYITSDDGFYRIKGYSVYYERNQMMQDYMILRKDARRVESGANDRVIRDFKQRMEGRKKEAVSRRGTIHTLGMVCSALSVAVLAGGVVMFNNYQKMKEMETVLVSVLPAGVEGWKDYSKNKDSGDDIVVEEIKGNVYPTSVDGSRSPSKTALNGEQDSQGAGISDSGAGASGQGADMPDQGAGVSGQGMNMSEQGADMPGQGTGASGQGASVPGQGADTSGQGAGASGQGASVPGQGAGESGQGAGASGQGAGASGQEAGASGQSAASGGGNSGQAEMGQAQGDGGEPAVQESDASIGKNGGNSTAIVDYPVTNMKPGESYTVGEGETLYGICFKLYDNLDYLTDICALNKLDDMNKISAGQKLILPDLSGIQ